MTVNTPWNPSPEMAAIMKEGDDEDTRFAGERRMKYWRKLCQGSYEDEMIYYDNRWFALIKGRKPSRVVGRPIMCLRYYRQDFTEEGVTETYLIVAEDGTCKED